MASKWPTNPEAPKNEKKIDESNRFCIKLDQGTIPVEDLNEKSLGEVHDLLTKAKYGKFTQVWEVLDKKPHYMNCIPEVRAWGILHQAAYLRKKTAVEKALSYPECNPFIKTNQDADKKYGPGRTADELTVNTEIKNIIIEGQQNYVLRIGTSKHLKGNEDYLVKDRDAIESLAKFIESQDWEKVYGTLKCNSHLINVLFRNTGLTALHEVVIINSLDLVTQMLDYPASNPYVETVESASHRHGSGKTPGDLATDNDKIIDVIEEKKDEMIRNYLSLPVIVLPWKSAAIFLAFFSRLLEDYQNILCPNGMLAINQDFQSLLKEVFCFVNNDTNSGLAKREVAYQIRNFDFDYSNLLEGTEVKPVDGKLDFYSKIIQIYTREDKKLIYHRLNKLFHEQFLLQGKDKNDESGLVLGTYALILNALLMHWDGLKPYHGYTYRAVTLEPGVQAELVNEYEFSFLNFLSCSIKEVTKYPNASCMLRIDNSTVCPWSPKDIGKYAATPEQWEYLYPCGARFKVTPSDSGNYINLKLIAPQ